MQPRNPAAQNRIQQRIEQRQNARQNNPARNANPAAAARNANPAAAARQQVRDTRQADRAERRLQQREDRAIRNLPPAQRAQRRQEIQQQRVQRREQRQDAQQGLRNQNQNVQQNQNQNRNNAQRSANRANGQARVNAQAARQGRFAAAAIAARQNANQNARANRQQARAERLIARQAWRRGLRAAFVPWAGAVFWPYAYSDLFDYTFFPYSYDDAYWAYAYDDMFDGVFYADGGPYADYAYAPATSGSAPNARASAVDRTAQQACAEPGQGITAWPFAQIQQAVQLNGEQKQLLGDLERAAKEAAQTFKAACPNNTALTPPGRLQAVTTRLQATLDAVQVVKSPLTAFYNSLSDEQKARFNRIGPALGQSAQDKTARDDTLGAGAKACGDAKPGLVNLPIEAIEDTVKPNEQQQTALDRLEQATKDAVGKLASACPDDIAQTPPGRLEATETRLKAMLEAARTVQPALEDFYAALDSEQKSRFNTMKAADADNG